MEHDDSSEQRGLRRRTVLTSGIIGAAALGLGLAADPGNREEEVPAPAQPLASQTTVSVERVYSEARRREVDLVMMYPAGVPREDLPVCLMLHGRFGSARKSVVNLPQALSASVAGGEIPPYAFMAVDGGANNYWHRNLDDDPLWMLLDEVPKWLRQRELGDADGQPFAVSGISMGGFGALLYARRRQERGNPLQAAAVVSPALLTNWPEMSKRKAFANEAEWTDLDPLRHVNALAGLPVGIWCGTSDRFINGARQFIDIAHPELASTTPGSHNTRYYREVLPEVVKFVGKRLHNRTANAW
jgi:pimeloyl-ACP methyl ester carboxylesterase